jgi:endonuclease-3
MVARRAPKRAKKAAAGTRASADRSSRPRGYQGRRVTPQDRTRAARVVKRLRAAYPDAHCALDHRDAYQLLVATILSAQCTDERVNQVTPELFHRWPTPGSLARAPQEELEDVVRSTGFFRNKAKNLVGMASRLVEAYGGEVPRAMEDLLTLPGVARKTANVVRGVIWGLADGVVVDTHVARISRLLGWTKRTDPVHIERDLMALHPRERWIDLSHLLIHHGRAVCVARRPRCGLCPVRRDCPSAQA